MRPIIALARIAAVQVIESDDPVLDTVIIVGFVVLVAALIALFIFLRPRDRKKSQDREPG